MWEYQAKLDKVVDGDTIYLICDLGFYLKMDMKLRVAYVDTPEIRGVERKEGLEVKDLVAGWFDRAEFYSSEEWPLLVTTHKPDKGFQQDKYGRWVGVISAKIDIEGSLNSLNDYLLDLGHETIYVE